MEEKNDKAPETLKFLCSYNGKILPPRLPGAKLRYAGGFTRVLAVDRSVTFAELMVKIGEFCGFSATLKCQLPSGDLETLVTITSDEDLANLLDEYSRLSPSSKVRAVLSRHKSAKTVSPPPSVDNGSFVSPPSTARYFVPRPPSVDNGSFVSPPSTARYFVPRPPRFPAGAPPPVTGLVPVAVVMKDGPYHHHHSRQARVSMNQNLPRSFYWQ